MCIQKFVLQPVYILVYDLLMMIMSYDLRQHTHTHIYTIYRSRGGGGGGLDSSYKNWSPACQGINKFTAQKHNITQRHAISLLTGPYWDSIHRIQNKDISLTV